MPALSVTESDSAIWRQPCDIHTNTLQHMQPFTTVVLLSNLLRLQDPTLRREARCQSFDASGLAFTLCSLFGPCVLPLSLTAVLGHGGSVH
eukprot:1594844-Amphidinium_carterae.1